MAFQVETFASWSRVVTTISSPGPSVAPIERPMCSVSVDMFWPNLISSGRAGSEEVGHCRVRLLDDVIAQRRLVVNAPLGVGVHVAVVLGDRVDHPLWHLRAARPIEEGDRSPVLLAGERREFGAQGIDIERGHAVLRRVGRSGDRASDGVATSPRRASECSVLPVNVQLSIRTAGTTTPPRNPLERRRSFATHGHGPASAAR